MSARDAVLASVRAALAEADRTPREVPRDYRATSHEEHGVAMLDLFVSRVEDYRAVVTRCAPADVASAVRDALGDAERVVVPDGLPYDVPHGVADDGLSALDLDRVDAVVTGAAVGIAVTGTLVLDHGPGQGRRAISLVPDLHVCVLRADQVVRTVPEAVALLHPARPQTWVSGPSATSDIELSRVEGVHGPRTLHVVLVDG